MLVFTKELKYLPMIKAASAKYNVPVPLILAHIKQESNFDPNAYLMEPARNDMSAGLMQVLLKTAQGIDPSVTQLSLFDPEINIGIGTRYIARNLARYPGDIKSAIAAFNAGTAYKDANGNYISKSGNKAVQGYVDKVYGNYTKYVEWLDAGNKTVDVAVDAGANATIGFGLLLLIASIFIYKKWRS